MKGRNNARVHAIGAIVLVACALLGAGVVGATDEATTTKSTVKSVPAEKSTTSVPAKATTVPMPAKPTAVTTTTPKPAAVATTSGSRPRNTKLPVMYVPPEQRKPATINPSVGKTTTAAKPAASDRPIAVANAKDYGMTVSASRSTAKPAPVATKPAPLAKSMPSTAERMSKSSVARPVVTSGPKAAVAPPTNPAKITPAAPSARPNVAAAKPVVSPAKQSLAAAAASQPGWSFRNTQAGGASTTKVVATTVAGGPPAATKPAPVKPATKVAAKPVAKPAVPAAVAAKPAVPAVKVAAVAAKPAVPAAKPVAVAAKPVEVVAKPSARPAAKPTAAPTKPMPGVQLAGSSTASAIAKPATKPTVKPATPTALTAAAVTAGATVAAPAKGATKPVAAPQQVAAQTGKRGAPIVPAVQTLGAAFMEQREMYVYNSLDRRDPFQSLVSGSFEGTAGTPMLDVSSMKLVGIVWGGADKFALVEDSHGHGFVLRVGDPVLNGYIAGLTKEELIVKQSSYGDTQTVTIQLQRKDGVSNAN